MQLLKTFFISAVTLPRTCKQILMCEIRDEQLYVKYLKQNIVLLEGETDIFMSWMPQIKLVYYFCIYKPSLLQVKLNEVASSQQAKTGECPVDTDATLWRVLLLLIQNKHQRHSQHPASSDPSPQSSTRSQSCRCSTHALVCTQWKCVWGGHSSTAGGREQFLKAISSRAATPSNTPRLILAREIWKGWVMRPSCTVTWFQWGPWSYNVLHMTVWFSTPSIRSDMSAAPTEMPEL